MRLKKRNRGFTLIEMVISTLILCASTVALAGLLSHGLDAWKSGTHDESTAGGMTLAMQRLSGDIRDGVAARVQSSTYGPMLIVTFPGTVTDPLTHETVYDPSSLSTQIKYYLVYQKKLYRVSGSSASVIGSNIDSIEFGASGGSVTIKMNEIDETKCTSDPNYIKLQVHSCVTLRNYHT